MRERYEHQDRAIQMLREALRSGKRSPMLSAPTGSGKTKTASDIAFMAVGKGKRFLFVVDALSLIDQTVEAFFQDGHRDIGVIQADHCMTNYSAAVQIASVQTLRRRQWPDFDIGAIDEAHVFYEEHAELLKTGKPIIGLSATPWTKGLGLHYDCLISPATHQDMIDAKRILPLEAYAPSSPDLQNVKIRAGEYDEGALSIVMRGEKLVADAVETWKELGEGRPTLGYAVDRAHGKHMTERFNKAGIAAGYIDGDTSALDRKLLQRRLESGELKVIWSVGTMIKGCDLLVSCGIDCQPTRSHMRHVQKCGRVIRTRTGAQHGLWLDHAGNCLRLGMPVDIIRTELDTTKKGERAKEEAQAQKLASKCPKCQRVKTAKICVCGYESKRETDLTEGAGQLARIGGDKAGPKKAEPTLFEKQEFYQQVRAFQIAKGKADGWSAHLFRDKFGEWPQGMKNLPPMKISPEVANYIKSKQIRFAKGMARRHA